MFDEEEWAEALPGDGEACAALKAQPLSGKKSKGISKRCLKRTLQTLGSVPDWDSIKPPKDSDGEIEEASVHVDKKKKRIKKRRKAAEEGGEEEQQKDADVPETPSKKKHPARRKQKKISPSTVSETVTDGDIKDSTSTQDATEKKMTRKQWKVKMKNKRRCKNKFLQNSTQATKVQLKSENAGKTKSLSASEGGDADATLSARAKSKKSSEAVPVNTPPSENANAFADQKSNGTNSSKPDPGESVSKGLKTEMNPIPNPANPHEHSDRQTKVKMGQKANKLRHILKAHVDDSTKNLEVKQEVKTETPRTTPEGSNDPADRSSALRSRMEKRLESARFRYINELLYTSASGEAKRMFKQDPQAIGIYHRGYIEQVKRWPANPVDSIISSIRQKPSSLVVADFGCGDCKIARSVKNKVHCFDLAPVCDLATLCDMAKVPLADSTVDIAVFCLSLMGTNLTDFLAEANRVLVMGGTLKIAEVASRFENVRQFLGALSSLGFKMVNKDTENSHFYSFEFVKTQNASAQAKKIKLQLKPCLYKKR